MNIRLVGALPRQLKEVGLKPGDRFQDVQLAEGHRKGAVKVRFLNGDEENVAVIYPENYEKYYHGSSYPKRHFRNS